MSGAHVFIDRSQFPQNVRRDLLDSLRSRAINHKFHYESYKQAAKWLALHDSYSPARTDTSCTRIYDAAFSAAASTVRSRFHLVGLGCGGGQKETRLLGVLQPALGTAIATMVDVSLPLLLTAREGILSLTNACQAVVCDLATGESLREAIDENDHELPRLLTLFGVIPNFNPHSLLRRITPLLRANDSLLIGANLSPGSHYLQGVEQILPQYDNPLTRDWLMTLLLDLGFECSDGELAFAIETDESGFHRIAAHFQLRRDREIIVSDESIGFVAGDRIRVFFSYRHTTETMRSLLGQSGIAVHGEWSNDRGEEGVFLCRKRSN